MEILLFEDSDKQNNVPNITDFNIICRLCLKVVMCGKYLNEIEQEIKIQSLIESYTPLKISETIDNFPQKICRECINFLIQIHIFHSICLLNNDLLQTVWSESSKPITSSTEHIDNAEFLSNTLNPPEQDIIQNIINEQIELYKCKSCPEVFQTKKQLTQHRLQIRHSRTNSCPCPYCGRKFNQRTLQNHLRTHTKEKPFACEQCGTAFAMKENLHRHMKNHIKQKTFCCKSCDKTYRTGKGLATHLLLAHKDEQFNWCNNDFDNFKCFVCDEFLENTDDLMIHIKSHGQSYLCSTCGKVFGVYSRFVTHMKSHSAERPFTCSTCNKSFGLETIWKAHQITHIDEKPFECEVCHKQFKRLSSLKLHAGTHIDSKPPVEVKYFCMDCGKGFTKKTLLDIHTRIHTGNKKYECKICTRKFVQQSHLLYHMRIHSGEKPYACEYCGKTFALNGNLTVHKRLHTGERPYQCRICQKGFTDTSSCKKHEIKFHGSNIEIFQDQKSLK